MNQAKYASLSAAQRKVIDNHCTSEWAEKVATPFADFEESGHPKLAAEAGHEAYTLTADQVAAWRKAAEPLTVQWASVGCNDRVSGDCDVAAGADVAGAGAGSAALLQTYWASLVAALLRSESVAVRVVMRAICCACAV
jgi:hypothetical protein